MGEALRGVIAASEEIGISCRTMALRPKLEKSSCPVGQSNRLIAPVLLSQFAPVAMLVSYLLDHP
jgi:hypothetical protein